MKYLLTIILIFTCLQLTGQKRKIRIEYTTGAIEAKGRIITCPGYEKYFGYDSDYSRKIGKWIYYYNKGPVKRIEYYKKIRNCSSPEIPVGVWHYFDREGKLTGKEEYRNGRLWKKNIAEFYRENKVAGKILIRNGKQDTIFVSDYMPDSQELIRNNDFQFYYGPPKPSISNGQHQIEDQIPFWHTPNKNTPDYYNPLRRLIAVPDNLGNGQQDSCTYTGIILYHDLTRNILPVN